MFFVLANNLGLNLVNTRIMDNGTAVDLLGSFDDLLDWAVAVGTLDKMKAAKAKKKWSGSREAKVLFSEALGLRNSLKQIADDLAHSRPVSKSALDQINAILRRKSGFFEIQSVDGGFEKQFHSETDDINGLLVPIAESTADLLCFGDLAQVKKCENESCVLHFYDTSKNHRRRWCSMAACGNRAKANSFYKRKTLRAQPRD
ncbi:MAG TPA: ABATE domain-containing protein [Pyrinomonadaceae bacterium]|jgi:predicted RNA-binding Zn ribbon-like protein|nr:ABATE domain-containing protein [Pyrinomonadaceae bacterium]